MQTFVGQFENSHRKINIINSKMEMSAEESKRSKVQSQQSSRTKSRVVPSFLKKTYEILDDHDNHHAIRWTQGGVGFVVTKQDDFSRKILPKYFKHSNYSSFVRQLNMYEFHKIREGSNQNHFHHDSFRKNNKALLSEIKRKPQRKKRKNGDFNETPSVDAKQRLENISSKPPAPRKNTSAMKVQIGQEPRRTDSPRNLLQSANECRKEELENTRDVVNSEKEHAEHSGLRISIQNIFSQDHEDDRISINNELPGYPTREILCPSNNNIYLFPPGTTLSNSNLFI